MRCGGARGKLHLSMVKGLLLLVISEVRGVSLRGVTTIEVLCEE